MKLKPTTDSAKDSYWEKAKWRINMKCFPRTNKGKSDKFKENKDDCIVNREWVTEFFFFPKPVEIPKEQMVTKTNISKT